MLEEIFQITLSDLTGDEQSGKELALFFHDLFSGATGDLLMLEEGNLVFLCWLVE